MARSAAPPAGGDPNEFEQIARLYRPLTEGSPEALGLMDDVAVLPGRPGFDLVLTKDAMVAGVHFRPDEPLDRVARKLLRVNLSDLAAKAAEPHGYLLAVAWPSQIDFAQRRRFAEGLAQDQAEFGVRLLGGDTVSTPGPFTASLTMLGWSPAGQLVRRSGARPGDIILVSGTIGDAGLGLATLTGQLAAVSAAERDALAIRHRLPTPRLALRQPLRSYANAATDVSDGLLADAGHIGAASRSCMRINLDRLPLSSAACSWLSGQPDEAAALIALATSGDDYEIVCTVAPQDVDAMIASSRALDVSLSAIGEVCTGEGLVVDFKGQPRTVARTGWSHG